jgi:hypothetical protein
MRRVGIPGTNRGNFIDALYILGFGVSASLHLFVVRLCAKSNGKVTCRGMYISVYVDTS